MVARLDFPPSVRDFDVHRRIVVYGYSTRQVAQEHNISQTRVRQLVERVGRWVAKVLPMMEVAEEDGLRLARQVAVERLDFFYSQAMHGWHVGANPRCLGLALRITMAQARLPCIPGRIEALAADVTEGPLPEYLDPQECLAAYQELADEQDRQRDAAEKAEPTSAPETHPPVMDCSASDEQGNTIQRVADCEPSASSGPAMPTEKLSPREAAARRAFFAPAHCEFDVENEPPGGTNSGETKTDRTIDLNVEEAIRRHERRQRRRERRRVKAK